MAVHAWAAGLTTPVTPASARRAAVAAAAAVLAPVGAAAFDVAPTSGQLAPGCAQRCEIMYYAVAGQRASALAVCGVLGGRALELPLSAETGEIRCTCQLSSTCRSKVCSKSKVCSS